MRLMLDAIKLTLIILYGATAFLVMWLWPILLAAGLVWVLS